MDVEFTAHNVRLDDGTYTKPDAGISMDAHPWFTSARRILETAFPGDKTQRRLADLGCLEGGYSVEFARMGFQVLGIEVRESNMAACRYVKARTNLPNLEFVRDDAFNLPNYGMFDGVFCCGLLYHLDRPRQFLEMISSVTTKLVILQTHFATDTLDRMCPLPRPFRKLLAKMIQVTNRDKDKFQLSAVAENEQLPGRWYTEFPDEGAFRGREQNRWSSWDNRKSFWIQREYLLQAIRDVGFDVVMEQFDSLGPNIAESMLRGTYHTESRGTFIGIKTPSG